LADVREWLHRPENQFKSDVFIIRWDGHTPSISTGPHRNRLLDLDEDNGLASVVLIEHKRRKCKVVTEFGGLEEE
jgi:hypothetical protein